MTLSLVTPHSEDSCADYDNYVEMLKGKKWTAAVVYGYWTYRKFLLIDLCKLAVNAWIIPIRDVG